MDLKQLYRDVILDHYKKPRNAEPLAAPDYSAKCKNPSCGDRITLELGVKVGRIDEIGVIGSGCAISQASGSMMAQALKGKSLEEAKALYAEFRRMIVEGAEDPNREVLGDLVTMQGVAKLHARVKCAMCGWSALEAALDERKDEIDMDLDETMPAASRAGGNV